MWVCLGWAFMIWLAGLVVMGPLILGLCRAAAMQDENRDQFRDNDEGGQNE